MTRGLPASFKSSWAKDRAEKLGWVRVSLDDLRDSVYGGWKPRREKYILNLRDAMIRSGIEQDKTVVVDATNLHPKHERRLRALAEELGVPFEIEDSFLQKTPMECIEADLHRGKDAVGSKVIWDMYTKYLRPKAPASLKEKSDKRRALLVDLDGSLCQNVSGRSYYDMTRVGEDKPNPLVAFLVDCVNEAGGYYADVLFITGRTEDGREATEKWLKDNCLEGKGLFMREIGDKRKDNIVKRELIEQKILPNWEILGAIDNSLNCCLEYYTLGIETLKAGIPTESY